MVSFRILWQNLVIRSSGFGWLRTLWYQERYEIKNAQFGSNYSITMRKLEPGYTGSNFSGYKLRMEFAKPVPSSKKTWNLEKILEVAEPETPKGNFWP